MQVATVVKNGKVVHPSGVVENGWLGIEGRKSWRRVPENVPEGARMIDAKGNYVLPGFIDPHVHMDWPIHSFEDGCRFTSNAVASGVTCVLHFMLSPRA